ncbi:hypothetical protein FHW79_004559 [Azospirillum sp. OGB3]|nr:hypothetical protein [Azospirillum sp. OGB3]
MKKSRFCEEPIIGTLREQEAGRPTAELCRKHGISETTFSRWTAKYGGPEVSEAKRLKTLEDENSLAGASPIKVATRMSPEAGPGHAPIAINARSAHHMRGRPL